MISTELIVRPRVEVPGHTHIIVARFMEHAYQHDDFQGKPDAKIWIVQADASVREKTGKSWCVWIDPDFYESNRKYGGKILSWIDKFDRKRTKLGFCEGRPMTSMAMKIPTCLGLDLPAILYRVVHSEHPWDGVRARGCEKIEMNPLTFQMHFQRHLKWSCRDLSPFMSATDCLAKARRICAVYAERGFSGIDLLVIRTSDGAHHGAWSSTRVFHVRTLIKHFDLPNLRSRRYFDNEWLIEGEIPLSRCTRVPLHSVRAQCSEQSWEGHCVEARAMDERNLSSAKKRRRLAAEEDDEVSPRKYRCRTRKFAKVDH